MIDAFNDLNEWGLSRRSKTDIFGHELSFVDKGKNTELLNATMDEHILCFCLP